MERKRKIALLFENLMRASKRRRNIEGENWEGMWDETVDQNMEDPTNDEDNDAVIAAFSQAAADVGRKPAGRIPKL